MQHILEAIGAFVLTHLANIGRIALLYGETMRQVTRRLRVRSIIYQMAHLGADSLLIVGLTRLFTGIVLTLQIAHEFIRYGAQSTIGAVIAIGIGRELGPVLVGVVCAGRVGVMAVSAVNYLIVPRMLACMVVVPILTVFGDVIGVLGGYFTAVYYSGISGYTFLHSITQYALLYDMTGGLVKAIFFGNVIAVLGCYYGLHAPRGAEGVGTATMQTVVTSIIVIFILNAVLTFFLF